MNNTISRLLLPKRIQEKILHVFLALCVHRSIDCDTHSLIQTLTGCPNPRFTTVIRQGDALIDRSRSIVASRFIQSDNYDILFFIDDDIIFNPQDLAAMCLKMNTEDIEILGGTYLKKQDVEPVLTFKGIPGVTYKFGEGAGIQEVIAASTGFLGIKKSALRKMIDSGAVPLCHPNDLKFYPFFQPQAKLIDGENVYLSEDWAFAIKAKELGIRSYIDGSIKLGHAGRYVYTWDDIYRLRGKKENIHSFEYLDTGHRVSVKRTDLTVPNQNEAVPGRA